MRDFTHAASGAQVNVAAVLVLWDQVFGTDLRAARAPERVGIDGHALRAPGCLAGLFEAFTWAHKPAPR